MTHSPAQIADPSPGKLCPECGYDLRGIASQQCPECGLNVNDPNYSSILWANRARIGRFKAFWKTALLATFRPKRFAKAIAHRVDYRAANRFRWIVVALATLPAIVLVVLIAYLDKKVEFRFAPPETLATDLRKAPVNLQWDLTLMWSAGMSIAPIIPLAAFVTFAFWTASPAFLFRRRGLPVLQQNRALAMSRYACAPLAGLIVMELVVIGAPLLAETDAPWVRQLQWLFIALAIPMGICFWGIFVTNWWGTLAMLSATTGCGRARLILSAAAVPLGWAISVGMGFIVVPCIGGFIAIVVDSLR